MSIDPLSSNHRHALEQGSGITPEAIAYRGYRTITVKAELRSSGFSDAQSHVPALLDLLWGANKDYEKAHCG